MEYSLTKNTERLENYKNIVLILILMEYSLTSAVMFFLGGKES